MMFITTLISLTTAATFTAAAALSACPGSAGVGAAYIITNEDENCVVSHNIAQDGTLSFAGVVSAHGRGGAAAGTPGPDPFFTQDSVKVAGNHLFTVNAGSNTVVMFNIDQNKPGNLKMVGKPVSSGGEFPTSVAFSVAKNMACVVNGGAVNGVQCYKPDEKLGLIAMANTNRSLKLPQTTPPTGPPGTVSDVLFSEDSKKLLVSVKGVPPTPGFVASWDVADDGSLSANFTASPPAQGGLLPFSMSIIPGKNAVLATDAGIGFSTFDLSTLGAAGTTAKSQVFPIAGQGATCWSSFSKKTGSFFLTDIKTDMVTEVAIADDLSGKIVKQYPLTPGSATIDNAIANLPNNDFLYILASNATEINVLALNGQGQAAKVQTLNLANESSLKLNPNRLQGMAVFVKSDVQSGKAKRVIRERN